MDHELGQDARWAAPPQAPPPPPPPSTAPIFVDSFPPPAHPRHVAAEQQAYGSSAYGSPAHGSPAYGATPAVFGAAPSRFGSAPTGYGAAQPTGYAAPSKPPASGPRTGMLVVRVLFSLAVVGVGNLILHNMNRSAEDARVGDCVSVAGSVRNVPTSQQSTVEPVDCGTAGAHKVLATGSMVGVPYTDAGAESAVRAAVPGVTDGMFVYSDKRWLLLQP